MANIKKGDLVQVITGGKQERGGDRGKQGRVLAVIKEKNRVIVEGVNIVTKHSKVGQTDKGVSTGGITTQEASIHASNVQLVDPGTKKPTRISMRIDRVEKNGVTKNSRVRVAKKSGKDII